jgi:hypothetical protein
MTLIDAAVPGISPNVNCLEGKRCPKCGSYGPFEVVASMRVLLYDNGTNSAEDATSEYGEEARTKCYSCRHEGQFGDFDE